MYFSCSGFLLLGICNNNSFFVQKPQGVFSHITMALFNETGEYKHDKESKCFRKKSV